MGTLIISGSSYIANGNIFLSLTIKICRRVYLSATLSRYVAYHTQSTPVALNIQHIIYRLVLKIINAVSGINYFAYYKAQAQSEGKEGKLKLHRCRNKNGKEVRNNDSI